MNPSDKEIIEHHKKLLIELINNHRRMADDIYFQDAIRQTSDKLPKRMRGILMSFLINYYNKK
jgi:hypothetical protein